MNIPIELLKCDTTRLLSKDEEVFTDPHFGVEDVDQLVLTKDQRVVMLLKNKKNFGNQLGVIKVSEGSDRTINRLSKIACKVDRIWNIAEDKAQFVYLSGKNIIIYDLDSDAESVLLTVPEYACTDEIEMTFVFTETIVGLVEAVKVVCFSEPDFEKNDLNLQVFPSRRVGKSVCFYTNRYGWQRLCTVHNESDMLSISKNGERAVWRTMRASHCEEAELGEFFGCDLAISNNSNMFVQLTKGAGRVYKILISGDAKYVIYTCNNSSSRPITTNLSMYYAPFVTNYPPESNYLPNAVYFPDSLVDFSKVSLGDNVVQLLGPGLCIDDFQWMHNANNVLVFNIITGCMQTSYYTKMDCISPNLLTNNCLNILGENLLVTQLNYAVTSTVIALTKNSYNSLAHITESIDEYPFLILTKDDTTIHLNEINDPTFDNTTAKVVEWEAKDGLSIQGVLYQYNAHASNAKKTAPALIVHIHGGPAVSEYNFRSNGTQLKRYPYRHLLTAGYDVFKPLYRGTLGYGDAFASANISTQGHIDFDLGDIIAGVEYLKTVYSYEDRIGVFGGSYGGYLTMRCLATTSLFKAGIPMYGFIHFRWMSLETGDLTWENEYSGQKIAFPLDEKLESMNLFSCLDNITAPALFLHGELDDICPLSQSKVAFKTLQLNKVITSLVVYPNEKHGFDNPLNKQDVLRRSLAWFKTYIPI